MKLCCTTVTQCNKSAPGAGDQRCICCCVTVSALAVGTEYCRYYNRSSRMAISSILYIDAHVTIRASGSKLERLCEVALCKYLVLTASACREYVLHPMPGVFLSQSCIEAV